MTIDEEWEFQGVTYWLTAVIHVPSVPSVDHGSFFGTPYARTIYESGEVEVLDLRVWIGDMEISEPRVLEAARAYAKEYV